MRNLPGVPARKKIDWVGVTVNSVNLVGRLVADPESRHTETNVTISNFRVAVNRQFKNKTGEYEADFINCVAFGKTAEFVQKYFVKGQFIGVTGRIQTRKWVAEDGTNRHATEVVADSVHFTSSAGSGQASQAAKPATSDFGSSGHDAPSGGFVPVDGDDELPF